MKFKIILVFVLLLLLSTGAKAVGTYQVVEKTLSSCSCDIISNPIYIENNGVKTEFYSVTQQGSAADWSKVFPATVSVKPGETLQVSNLINPPCGKYGEFTLNTNIVSTTDQKVLNQVIELEHCANFKVSPVSTTNKGCSCSSHEFSFLITNTGKYSESFDINMGDWSQYSTVTSLIELDPGKSSQVVVYVNPCKKYGNYSLSANVLSKKSEFKAQVPLKLELTNCQDTNSTQVDRTGIVAKGTKIMLWILSVLVFVLLVVFAIFVVRSKQKTYYKKVKIKQIKGKRSFSWKKLILVLLVIFGIGMLIFTLVKLTFLLFNIIKPIVPPFPTNSTDINSSTSTITNISVNSNITNTSADMPKFGFNILGKIIKSINSSAKSFIVSYYPYIMLGFIVLALIILVLTLIKKKK
ncbi:MAG: hypothetical protein MAG795_01076 [Candidatus Woesearchaeota archaeon]|nr:hypothetical protein [Candidatus Woesearchaeota archaeon]